MSSARLAFSLSIILVLVACSNASVPTQGIETIQTQSVDTVMVPSPASYSATITFLADSCSYKGPQSVPAGEILTINWRIKTGVLDVYGLLPFTTDEQKSRDELIQAQEGLDIHRPALPDEFSNAGMAIGYKASGIDVLTVNTAGGPLHGPLHGYLYFGCWAAGQAYDVLGPVEIK